MAQCGSAAATPSCAQVKFNDFLKALPRADERDFEEDEDEEAMLDPNASAL